MITALMGSSTRETVAITPEEQDSALVGAWSEPFDFDIQAIHASLLPDGRVMYFEFSETPRVWDPVTGGFGELASVGYTLFCTGHSALSDGRLLFAGGGEGGNGYPYAAIYSPATDTWSQLPDMNAGRWYPTSMTLANGEALVISGQINADGEEEAHGGGEGAHGAHGAAVHGGVVHGGEGDRNVLPQVWTGSGWRDLTNAEKLVSEYVAMFLAPNGQAFMAGPGHSSYYLDTEGTGQWTYVAPRVFPGWRGYGSAVMYDDGKVLFVGGSDPPTATAEVIDLNAAEPLWRYVGSMETPRRQTNATILADGTVLITGGTSGPGFNNKDTPVLTAELWDPVSEQFTTMDSVQHPRWYHATALLLPDGRVLTAGGDEWPTAEIYSPPYLFQGPRPSIDSAPQTIEQGETFFVGTPDAAQITDVHLIRLGSVTHATNMDQRINRLSFGPMSGGLAVTAPTAELFPPGSYMLFLLNGEGVPSVAAILNVVVNDGGGAVYTAMDLAVDASPLDSADGNGVLEPGEIVEGIPAWRNDGVDSGLLYGEATDLTGPAGPIYSIEQALAHYGVVEPGETSDCQVGDLCYRVGVDLAGGERPATHWDASFAEILSDGDAQAWMLHVGESFTDVPRSGPFYKAIETLLHHGVTHGCAGGEYCPGGGVNRAAMAPLLLRAVEGPLYTPPACQEGAELFADVPVDSPFCGWIEELAARGVVVGCGGGNYCPDAPTSRAQVAVFLLKALEGDGYVPAECSGVFADVPCPSMFADWVEELFHRQVASGCQASPRRFCPQDVLSRGAIAVFLTATFGLDLYGP